MGRYKIFGKKKPKPPTPHYAPQIQEALDKMKAEAMPDIPHTFGEWKRKYLQVMLSVALGFTDRKDRAQTARDFIVSIGRMSEAKCKEEYYSIVEE